MSQEVYQIEGNWREVLHRTAASEITASLKIGVQGGVLVGNTNGSGAERIIRHVCVCVCVCVRARAWNWGRNSQQIGVDLTQEFRVKTVKNKGGGTHSGCQQNVLRSYEFGAALYPCDWLKVFRRNTLHLSSWSRSHGVTIQNTTSMYHHPKYLNN